MGAMYTFCKLMYGSAGFDIDFYVKLGDAVLTAAGYKDITGKDYVSAA
ncbi:XkdX family protein [Limosilactobacillus coleohominis]|nr:XkdX family protein [Limosilactobacillus coleohominis]